MTKTSPGKRTRLPAKARPMVLAFISTFVCTLLLSGVYLYWETQARTQLKAQVLKDVSQLRGTLESRLDANRDLTVGLAAFVTTRPDLTQVEFSAFASKLLKSSKQIANNFTYSSDRIIRFVHPIEGNEVAIGAVLSTHPDFAPILEALNRSTAPIIAGPNRLIQGGEALIVLEPLADEDTDTGLRNVWGQVSMMMDVDLFYQQTGVREFATRYELSIRGRDGRGASGEVFYGDSSLFHTDSVRQQITLSGGNWELAAKPSDGWTPALPAAHLITALALLLAVFLISYRMNNNALLLKKSEARANQAEQALELSHNRYRELTDAVQQVHQRSEATHNQALHDPLTGLPSRVLLIERLTHAINVTQRLGKSLALLAIDLEDFKPINDRYGYAAGDQVLHEIGKRLRSLIREVDTVARMGGDEFVVLIESIEDGDGVHIVADKVLSALTEPIEIQALGRRIACRVGANIGIVVARNQGIGVSTLLQQAEAALYAAKAAGRGCIAPGSGIG